MNSVWLKNVEVGAGKPKVIVPIVAATEEEILEKAKSLLGLQFDVVEWRVDFYEDAQTVEHVLQVLRGLREILNEIPILATFRTKKEGGEREISMDAYTQLNAAMAQSGLVDAVDVEILSGDEVVEENIRKIHQAGVAVVGSSHEFACTPPREELIARLCKEQEMGCDILKLAVMPQNAGDVLTLLGATEEMNRCCARQPVVTMSMSGQGVVSRLCGEIFGSAMTFGAVGQVSAPGQVQIEDLNAVLQIIHNAV